MDARATTVVACSVAALVAGFIPFAYWLGWLALRVDIRVYGDGNPGAGNAWRAGGWRVGVPGAVLDYGKGAVPVFVAHYACGLVGWALVPVALAPVLGHAYSPFLRGRGGKAVAATFGIWSGLAHFAGFFALGIGMGIFWAFLRADGWVTVFGLLALLGYILLFAPGAFLLVVWVVNAGVVTWKHRRDLREPLRLRTIRPPQKAD
jgi:acyl phosphate:glycerol-3-phosphate acyltransferase